MNAKHVTLDHHTILNRIRQGILDLLNQGGLTAQELNLVFELETRILERLGSSPSQQRPPISTGEIKQRFSPNLSPAQHTTGIPTQTRRQLPPAPSHPPTVAVQPGRHPTPHPASAVATSQPTWPIPPPPRAAYNPAFAKTQAIPPLRGKTSTKI